MRAWLVVGTIAFSSSVGMPDTIASATWEWRLPSRADAGGTIASLQGRRRHDGEMRAFGEWEGCTAIDGRTCFAVDAEVLSGADVAAACVPLRQCRDACLAD